MTSCRCPGENCRSQMPGRNYGPQPVHLVCPAEVSGGEERVRRRIDQHPYRFAADLGLLEPLQAVPLPLAEIRTPVAGRLTSSSGTPVAGAFSGSATVDVPAATSDGGAAGVQVGSGNVQVNYFYGGSAGADVGTPPPAPEPGTAGSAFQGHAFISYVREDSGEVDELQRSLEAAGVAVWRDTASLWPGEDWRAKIRDAIIRDALAFIACFSSRGAARRRSHQNEELLLAVEQLRSRRPDDPWLIPVRFDDCDIPDLDLGAGRTLASLQRADLFGADRDQAAGRLVAAVLRRLRQAGPPVAAPGTRHQPGQAPAAAAARPGEAPSPEHASTHLAGPAEVRTAVSDEAGEHVNVPQDEPGASGAPGLGRRLFTARIPRHSGQLSVAFGAGDTLIVAEKDTTVHRWSLTARAGLPGAAPGPGPRFNVRRVDVGTRIAASTTTPAVAVSRGAQVTILHFGDGGHRTVPVPLGTNEFLIPADGERFATYDGRGVAVRDFADGSVLWRAPAPRNLAIATVNTTGTTVAMAGGPNFLAGSNKVVVATRDNPRLSEFPFANFPLGAGCQLGISPDGELVACASFREIVVVRARTGEIVHRKPLGSVREDVTASLGTRPHRLICNARGDILWYRGRRVVDVNWSAEKSRYLPQEGLCDDIAFDHANSRLAMVSESGQVDVHQWNPTA